MTPIRIALPFTLALLAAPALAASPFDGTWKANLAKMKFSTKPDEILLAGGSYTCKTCAPAYTVPADGKPHPVAGHDYFDTSAVTVVSPTVVKIANFKGGKPTSNETMTLAADGKTMAVDFHAINLATGKSMATNGTSTRVGTKPAGAHGVSGQWVMGKANSASESAMTQSFKVAGNAMTFSSPTGESYTATFDGPAVMQANDPGKTMITLKKIDENHVVETDSRDGKPVAIYDMLIAPGGKTMTLKIMNQRTGTTDTMELDKI